MKSCCSRCPKSLIHPRKLKNEQEENKLNEELEHKKSKAVRHLLLIRHGQYELDGKTDEERVLTSLGMYQCIIWFYHNVVLLSEGRQQAEWTGKRLKELDLPYTDMVKSTMTRAQETANIIASILPEVSFLEPLQNMLNRAV